MSDGSGVCGGAASQSESGGGGGEELLEGIVEGDSTWKVKQFKKKENRLLIRQHKW